MDELEQKEGVSAYVKMVLLYIISARKNLSMEKLIQVNREYKAGRGDMIMSLAEQLRQEGEVRGIEIGVGKGRQDALIKTARKMLEKGMQIDDVVEVTELSKDELSKLH